MMKILDRTRRAAGPAGWLFVLLLLFPHSGIAEEDEPYQFRFRTVETEHLRLIYAFEEHEYLLDHIIRCFENAITYHMDFFDYEPSEKVTIYFNDSDDFGYAGTTTMPHNWITLGIEPFEYVYETCPTNERMNWVINHELVHVVASDQAESGDGFYRKVFFGKVTPTDEDPVSVLYSYLTNPRRYAPRWYHEGIAVFMETWMAGGIGRSLTGYDEMTFRAMVRDSSFFYDVVGLESEGTAQDFQIGQVSYLYGTRFFSYLAVEHGPEKLIEWVKRDTGSCRYFSSQFEKVFGTDLDDEWSRWIEFERDWQQANLDSIRQYPTTPYRELCKRPLGSVSRQFYNAEKRELYAAVNYPGEFAHIAAIDIDTGTMRKICEIPTPALYYVASLAYDDSTGTLFFTTDNSRSWRDINRVDIETGKVEKVFRDLRTGDLVFNRADRSLWGLSHDNGFTSIVQFPEPYEDGYELLTLDYGKDMFDIDISPDGRFLSGSLSEIDGSVRLVLMEIESLENLDPSYRVLWEFPDNVSANFVFSPDGSYLYGTSYYTGTSNIFRYDLESHVMEGVSNCESGFYRPLPISPDSIIAFRYTGDGMVPIIIPNETTDDICAVTYLGQEVVDLHPIVKDWMLGSPLAVDVDSAVVHRGDYSPQKSLGLSSAYPIVEGYKHYTAVGVRLNFMDPVLMNGLDLAISFTPAGEVPDGELAHFRAAYRYLYWTIKGSYNKADFYDLFGPTKTSRKGYSLEIDYTNWFMTERPTSLEYTIYAAGYGGLERLPSYQNIGTDVGEFFTIGAELAYQRQRKTIGSIEAEKGLAWTIATDDYIANSTFYPRVYANLDIGFLLPIDHTSIWLRTSAGHSFSSKEDQFSKFYFGGFGNNWIDHAEVNRYREYYSFPGVEINDIGGKNYGKAMLELTLPPIRFRRLGISTFYFNWMRFALFSSAIRTNIDDGQERRELVNLGAQMNLKIVFFSSLESTFSFGYAAAAEEGSGPTEEWMFSLKILR
jgi:hypothetical protein